MSKCCSLHSFQYKAFESRCFNDCQNAEFIKGYGKLHFRWRRHVQCHKFTMSYVPSSQSRFLFLMFGAYCQNDCLETGWTKAPWLPLADHSCLCASVSVLCVCLQVGRVVSIQAEMQKSLNM